MSQFESRPLARKPAGTAGEPGATTVRMLRHAIDAPLHVVGRGEVEQDGDEFGIGDAPAVAEAGR